MISEAQGYQIYADTPTHTHTHIKHEDTQAGTEADSLMGGVGIVILTV